MKLSLFSLFFSISLFAGNVINQNIYEKEDSVDIMLSFDSPYEGKIIQKKEAENRVFILEDTKIDKKSITEINSHIVQKLQLVPFKGKLFIELSGVDDFEVDASKTVDNYGLRLRITPLVPTEELTPIKESHYETKKEDNIGSAYLKVMLILASLIAFLYLLKKWLNNRGENFQGNWLFDKKSEKNNSSIKVKQQRALDVKNRLALVSYRDKEYLLLLGSSNLLLDSFNLDEESKKNNFDEVIKSFFFNFFNKFRKIFTIRIIF